jgi:hypothetical protein
MKERPILFSSEMVRAILDGCKSETRRVVNFGKNCEPGGATFGFHDFDWSRAEVRNNALLEFVSLGESKIPTLHVPFKHPEEDWEDDPNDDTVCRIYPKWHIGERLWVKEGFIRHISIPQLVGFVADGCSVTADWERRMPSIHMPRWASRLTLEIVSVKVERLQEIAGLDAEHEGIADPGCYENIVLKHSSLVRRYRILWDKLNGKKHPWESNPWVWVVGFKVVK